MAEKENDPHADPDYVDFQPSRSKKRKTSPSTGRFKGPSTDQEIAIASKGFVPANTKKWALKLFQEWIAQRNEKCADKKCPGDLLDKPDVAKLNFWLCRFVIEVRKQNGEPFPPKSIHHVPECIIQKVTGHRSLDSPSV